MTYDFIRVFGVSFTYTNMLQKKIAFVKRSFTILLQSRHVLDLTEEAGSQDMEALQRSWE
jgi:hypothetical protein